MKPRSSLHSQAVRQEHSRLAFTRSLLRAASFVFLILPLDAYSRTWRVSVSSQGDTHSIQAAIVQASREDSILVDPGTYYEAINFLGKKLYVMSANGPDVTIIDATGLNTSVVTFASWEPEGTLFSGFTVTGGTGTTYIGPTELSGGGIFCTTGSPLLVNNIVTKNKARFGGGMFFGKITSDSNIGSPACVNNVVLDNEATQNGGGIHVSSCYALITDNTISNNRCSFDGGGIIALMNTGSFTLHHNVIRDNSAGDHGGGLVWFCEIEFGCRGADIRFNIIDRNQSMGEDFGETGSGGGIFMAGGPAVVSNNTITRNRAFGEVPCSGGGIGIFATRVSTVIEYNIVAYNDGCGVKSDNSTVVLGANIFWSNGIAEMMTVPPSYPPNFADALMFVDPLFCNLEANEFSVSSNSPALKGVLYGAVAKPGCDKVLVLESTWGAIKSLFNRRP